MICRLLTLSAIEITLVCWSCALSADDLPNLNDLPSDLTVPAVETTSPAPGIRVWQKNVGYEDWAVAHALYLPIDWKPANKYPVIVEYPGNGNYKNERGDQSDGSVEGCQLGYGLSGGKGMIWVCLPFVDPATKTHAITWWGSPDETARYCKQTVARICEQYGGDPDRLVLTGFSRGAIACNFIGLRDDDIAALWRAFMLHSHYDGVREWNYPESDADSACRRLQRLGIQPQFISHELSVVAVKDYLKGLRDLNQFTFLAIPYSNHSASWVLKNVPERTLARKWLIEVLR